MLDPLSIGGFVQAASALSKMADRVLRKDADAARRVVAFCDRVKAILDGVVQDVERSETQGLEVRSEELKQWAGFGMTLLGDAVPDEVKSGLSTGLIAIADRLDSKDLGDATDAERSAILVQIRRGMGQLGGLADVLRFSLESKATAKPARKGLSRLSLGAWASETSSMLGASITTAVLAAGVSKIPVVGGTVASLMQGTVPESDDNDEA